MIGHYEPLGIGAGTLLNGRYDIARRLGAGSMSVVFEALDRSLNKERVALKLFSPALMHDKSQLARFRNEVLITRKLTHPNIVRTYDFGETQDGQCFITMEYIEGGTLEEYLRNRGGAKLSLSAVVRILADLCRALGHAHGIGVVHRDLKCANVLISSAGEIKVADFGLSQTLTLDQHVTQAGECVGTPSYMAPEQVQGGAIDARCDIYAIGIIAYELVMGEVPFQEENWFKLASRIVKEPLPRIASKRSGIPDWYESFVHKAAAKEPDDRFQSAEEMAQYLEERLPSAQSMVAVRPSRTGTRPDLILQMSRDAMATVEPPRIPATTLIISAIILLLLISFIHVTKQAADRAAVNVKHQSSTIKEVADSIMKVQQAVVYTVEHREEINSFVAEHEKLKQAESQSSQSSSVSSAKK